jgi:O-acetyl-ADP-ribose deacetylase (regulator of RNase III)
MGRLTIVHGDLFAQGVDALVNAVNCVGVMGAGIARDFRVRFPEMFAAYAQRCRTGKLRPGIVHVFPVAIGGRAAHVINVPTKDHWRDPSTLALVELGLAALVDVVNEHDYGSIAMPALGCGLGGLSLEVVMPLMQSAAHRMHANVELRLVLRPNPREKATSAHLAAMIRASENAGLYDVDEFDMPAGTRSGEQR